MDVRGDELLIVDGVKKYFPITRGIIFQKAIAQVQAVDGVSFSLRKGETLGIVGESGCGKSTLARCIVRLLDTTEGRIMFDGRDVTNLSRVAMRPIRREMTMIFQDPYASLNPRKRVGFIIGEPLEMHKLGTPAEVKTRVQELLEVVGLNPEHYNRFPHEFSGGQRQRIGVARALAVNPKLIVCDEPVSALDVSVQAQILNLLKDLQDDFGLTYVFIAHDLNVVRHISDRVMVMYLGQVVGGGDPRPAVPGAEASVHGRAPLSGSDPESRARASARVDRPRRRRPEPGQSSECVPIPSPLPPLRRGALRRRGTAALSLRRRPRGEMPLPARALADDRLGDEAPTDGHRARGARRGLSSAARCSSQHSVGSRS